MTGAKVVVCLATVAVAVSGCGASPTAPSVLQQPAVSAADLRTLSGQVYASTGPVFPLIQNATVEVNEADGTSATVTTNAEGFYRITVRRGSITVTTSKDGFEAKQLQFDVAQDTVVNFSLDPR